VLAVAAEVIRRLPVYLLNSVNPYRLEGQKTAAIELLEQLGWSVPDHIVVPGGNLGNGSALGKALLEMQGVGLISRLPKVSVIQAAGRIRCADDSRERREVAGDDAAGYDGLGDSDWQSGFVAEGFASSGCYRRYR